MTESQERQIEEIKKEWIEEADKLPPVEIPHNCFCINMNKARDELTKKYTEKIRQVMEENNSMNSDTMRSLLEEELKKTYPVNYYGENRCYVTKKGVPFRLHCFNRERLVFLLEYASDEDDAKVGRFEDGDRFYFEDYSSVEEMMDAMRIEIDDCGE